MRMMGVKVRSELNRIINLLKDQIEDINGYIEYLEERWWGVTRKALTLAAGDDCVDAKRYAREALLIEKLIKLFKNAKLALEAVIIRLETVNEVGELLPLLSPVSKVLETLSKRLEEYLPDVAKSLSEAHDVLVRAVGKPLNVDLEGATMSVSSEEVHEEVEEHEE